MKAIRKIIAVSLLITLSLVGVSKGAVTTNGRNLTEGYFAPDGSYQFGEEELKRLNALENENLSFAEFLQRTAPACYDTLSVSEKEAFNKIPWENMELTKNNNLPSPRYTSWWATIQLDGASLRGEAWLTGRYAEMAIVQCYVRKPGSSQYVGYAYKSAENIKPENIVKAVAVCDPPSGTYIATGNFTWNTTDNNGNVIPYGYSDDSDNSISYVNPHG